MLIVRDHLLQLIAAFARIEMLIHPPQSSTHPITFLQPSSTSPLQPHRCDFCGKAFKRSQDLASPASQPEDPDDVRKFHIYCKQITFIRSSTPSLLMGSLPPKTLPSSESISDVRDYINKEDQISLFIMPSIYTYTINHHYNIDFSFHPGGIIAPENSPGSSVSESISESVSEIGSETNP